MKKIAFVLVALLMSVAANAQFEKGKGYLGASLSGIDLSSQAKQFHFGLDAKAGYLFQDNWMVLAQMGYDWHQKADNVFLAGAGLRYHIEQNGLYVGLGANYVHKWHDYDDLMPNINVGYTFFLNRTVTIEPEVYYNQSLKNHSDYSGFGLRIGFGIYFE